MIAVLDYGAGNVGSVLKAVRHLGFPAERVDCPEFLGHATRLILPGQGHFAAMMKALAERRLLEALRNWLREGKPYLGICLGLQALYEASEEAPGTVGLGVLGGTVRRFEGIFKVPHVGWSQVEIKRDSKILEGIRPASFVYYCHSYYGPPTEETTAITDYGQQFAAAVEFGKMAAVQFHPEKSGEVGLRVLRNFLQT
ncbi:MAG: imidazole glycerol phosphate synthase subunit HisH [Acidobacteria bacterium]|nr:MAG: imidazole glycerol phosphate synthase subunit HisH [Acidobacteriota bacterium]